MTVTPQMSMDPADWKDLVPSIQHVLTKVSELMQMFGIQSIRRYRKTGIAGRPSKRDDVVQMPMPVNGTISGISQDAGSALLDVLEVVGICGVGLTLSDADTAALTTYWENYGREPQHSQESADVDLGDAIPSPSATTAADKPETDPLDPVPEEADGR